MSRVYSFPGVALVTGAGGTGIGAAVAKAFAAAGCERIAITDINQTSLEETKKSILASYPATRLVAEAGDVADEPFVEAFLGHVVRDLGRIDYAVNCAVSWELLDVLLPPHIVAPKPPS
ncbi:hypothetical protein HFD88_003653 [Aspergillus terreus]|nr:hypothetical protein HFD88_003653 [Aspergillus terreus]